jgi:hypothetical protein
MKIAVDAILVGYTYSLGFFFGPGLPLSLGGALGSITGAALFRPAIAPPPLLRLPSILGGGASELGSGVSAPVAGTGVELDSSDLDADDGSGCVMVGAGSRVLRFGIEADVFRDEVLEPDTIRARASGATLRVTILVLREPLGVALAGVAIIYDEYIVSMDMARLRWAVRSGGGSLAWKSPGPGTVGGCWGSQAALLGLGGMSHAVGVSIRLVPGVVGGVGGCGCG